MPISKIKGNAINDDAINSARLDENLEFTGTEAVRIPQGTTAQRASAQSGDIRFNSTLSLMEYYDGTIWKAIDSPPVVSSISPASISDSDSSVDIVITGSNFQSGATVKAVGTDNSQINATTVTVTSSTQVTANFDGTSFSDALENYDIVLTNSSGLAGTLADSLAVNATPVWTTAASPTTLATVNDGDTISGSTVQVAATDAEGASLTYSLSSGSLPAGLSVQTDGTITGTVTAGAGTYASGGETYTPTVSVTDGLSTVNRTFAIVKKWYDGSTQALAAPSGQHIYDLGITTNGVFWIKPDNYSGSALQLYVKNDIVGGGWMLVWKASRTLRANGTISQTQMMTTDAQDTAELQQNRIGNYHARVSWDFMNKIAAMSNHRKAFMALYDTPYNAYDSDYAFGQKLGTVGRGTGSNDTITDVAYDPWQLFFNRSHWTTVAQEGGLSSSSGGNGLGAVNGNGTTFKFYKPGDTPGWDSNTGLLTGTVSSSTPNTWEDNSISNFTATGTYASSVGNGGRFWKSRHSGILIGDVNGGDEWIYSTQTSFSSESSSSPANEIAFMK